MEKEEEDRRGKLRNASQKSFMVNRLFKKFIFLSILLLYLVGIAEARLNPLTETTKYIHGLGIDEPLAVEQKGNAYYYHADGLGSIIALTDARQKVVQTYTYDSFGNMKQLGDKVKQPYTYTAREWDGEIKLYYNRARYRDPYTGIFTTKDPILHPANGLFAKRKSCGTSSFDATFGSYLLEPIKLNPYVYADGNPINKTDPMGLLSCDGKWRQVGWDRIFNAVCVCYWLCEPCDGTTIWGGNPRTLPRTFGTVYNASGDIESGDNCICKNKPGAEKGCCEK